MEDRETDVCEGGQEVNEIGKRIRYLRIARDMTQAGLAERVSPKTTKQHVWNWENGKIPNDVSMQRIADALGSTPAYIRYGVRGVQEHGEGTDVGRGTGVTDGR